MREVVPNLMRNQRPHGGGEEVEDHDEKGGGDDTDHQAAFLRLCNSVDTYLVGDGGARDAGIFAGKADQDRDTCQAVEVTGAKVTGANIHAEANTPADEAVDAIHGVKAVTLYDSPRIMLLRNLVSDVEAGDLMVCTSLSAAPIAQHMILYTPTHSKRS